MQYFSETVCLIVEFLLYWVKIIADFCPQIDIFKGNCWIRCFTNLFPQFCPRNFSQFEQLKKKEKILLVQNIFHKFWIPNIRIFLFQLTKWALSHVNSQSKYKHISYYPLDFIKGDQNAYDPNWYIFTGCIVLYLIKGKRTWTHKGRNTIAGRSLSYVMYFH